jgi:head-tail adaptor
MPIDLRGILTPVIGQVADLTFPDRVTIEEPVTTYDENNDPTMTWDDVDSDVPALIEPVNRDMTMTFPGIEILSTDVLITLPGDRDIRSTYRLRAAYVPPADPDPRQSDRWDVVGVMRDPARVTTMVLARRREPTPDEGS